MATKKAASVSTKTDSVKKGNSTSELIAKQAELDPKVWGIQQVVTKVDHFINKKKARKLVKDFNTRTAPIPKNAFMQPENFDKAIIQELLNLSGCKMLRVYFGLNQYNKVRLVLVGVDENHNDLYLTRSTDIAIPDSSILAKVAKSAGGENSGVTGSNTEEGAVDLGQSCPAYGSGSIITLP